MGHVLSEHRSSQTKARVNAEVNARDPKSSSEVQLFLVSCSAVQKCNR